MCLLWQIGVLQHSLQINFRESSILKFCETNFREKKGKTSFAFFAAIKVEHAIRDHQKVTIPLKIKEV